MGLDRASSNKHAVHSTLATARNKMGGELQGNQERYNHAECYKGAKSHSIGKHRGKMDGGKSAGGY